MKVKEKKKILAIFPWSGKNPSRERVSERESSPREEKTRGKRQEKEGKTTGARGDTIFYSQSES